jgi:hypothetical protein
MGRAFDDRQVVAFKAEAITEPDCEPGDRRYDNEKPRCVMARAD